MSEIGTEALAVGALSRSTGVTVRTLHHWDAIGLLVPSERTSAGHRRYTDADVRRLYRIVALRGLGMGLDAIAAVLGGDHDVKATVRHHLAALDQRIEATRALRDRVAGLLDAFDALGEPSTAAFIETIEVMTVYEQYYTPEQLAELEERRRQLGPEGMEQAQRDWATLIDEVREEHRRRTDPGDPRMQELARRWQALVEQFTGGNPEIAASLKRMYEDQGVERASRGMIDPELSEYVQRAMQAR